MSRARENADATSQAYIENKSTTQNLSGTYSTERMYFNDSYTLTGNVNVTGHLALGTIADADVVITQDSTERTITGAGTLEAGNVLQDTHRTSLTDMTGELGSAVTQATGYTLGSGVTFPAMSQVGHFTYDTATASGTQAITGVGFTPSALTLFAAQDTAGQASYGIGAPGVNYNVVDKQAWVSNYWVPNANNAIYMIQSSSIYSAGVVYSFDADGFTISWTKTGAKTGTVSVYYMAVR